MINYAAVRSAIVRPLAAYLGVPIVLSDQTGDTPPYPFVTYNLTSPYLETSAHGSESVTQEGSGIKRAQQKHVELVFSFTAHAKEDSDAYQLCYQIIEYFDFLGRDALRDSGIVVVEMTNAQNRDVFLTIEYERRVGCDVRFRVVSRSEMIPSPDDGDYIETAKIEGG